MKKNWFIVFGFTAAVIVLVMLWVLIYVAAQSL